MIVVAPGTRALEETLLGAIDDQLTGLDAERLRRGPLRIVVPSRSLRQHMTMSLVRHRGRGLAGVVVQTLFAAAIEILDRAGVHLAEASAVFPILVRRAAEREPHLGRDLAPLADGFAAALPSVSDLLDAGLGRDHADAIDELLAAQGGGESAAERARALLRVATVVMDELEQLGLSRSSSLLQRAADLVQRDPSVLPSRLVFIHGFADATGVAGDFIEALVRAQESRVFLDLPPEPGTRERGPSASYTARFRARIAHLDESDVGEATIPQIELIGAPGAQAEIRAVANRIRRLLNDGVAPESIGVVARDLTAYTVPIRTHFTRLAIPFSGLAATATSTATARRMQAWIELLKRRAMASVDRWLDVVTSFDGFGALDDIGRLELRVGLHACGAARLRDVVTLDAEALLQQRKDLPLPLRHGLQNDDEEESGDEPESDSARTSIASRRRLSGKLLRAAISAARDLQARWQSWPESASIDEHLSRLTDLAKGLAAPRFLPEVHEISRLLEEVPSTFVTTQDEFVLLVERACATVGLVPLGGRGGGTQILTVMESRARCWQHLFLIGMNADVFPRSVREDPLLPDWLRQIMATSVLPDIPLKGRGFDEDRYLFAQLLSASPHVTLSWQDTDDAGKVMSPSPLVTRLRLGLRELKTTTAPSLFSLHPEDPVVASSDPPSGYDLRPPYEHAVIAGLRGHRDDFAKILPLATVDVSTLYAPATGASAEITQARLALLAEIDAPPTHPTAQTLGPYFGFIGRLGREKDPRHNELFVTTLERMATCPWQTFVQRLLAIEPPPDALSTLPTWDAAMLGSAVHGALEKIVRHATKAIPGGRTAGIEAPWPTPAEVRRLIEEAALETLHDSGIYLPGMAPVFANQIAPYIEVARRTDWSTSAPIVDGVEREGVVILPGGDVPPQTIHFRADRTDLNGGVLRFTDYKTGNPPSDGKKPDTRRKHLLERIRRGTLLQAVAYAHARQDESTADRTVGRYLHLKPELDDEVREILVEVDDREAEQFFRQSAATVLAAWHEGTFFPRLIEAGKNSAPPACRYCRIRSACLHGDSTARARLQRHFDRSPPSADDRTEQALQAAWSLGSGNAPARVASRDSENDS